MKGIEGWEGKNKRKWRAKELKRKEMKGEKAKIKGNEGWKDKNEGKWSHKRPNVASFAFHFPALWLMAVFFWRFVASSCAFHIQPFVPSFPFILAFSRFMSFYFGFFVASCPLMSALCGFTSFHFGLLWLHLLSCRLCVTLSSFIFVFCAFICFHFGFVAASFLFTLVVSFPSILAFCAPLFYSFWLTRLIGIGSPSQQKLLCWRTLAQATKSLGFRV